MALTNTAKPSTTLTNTSRVNSAELWSTITSTWASETRTWDECASVLFAVSKVNGLTQVATATSYQSPDLATNVTNLSQGGAAASAWTNLTNITASDNNQVTCNITASNSDYLYVTDFDFAIPTDATIVGITAQIERADLTNPTARDSVVQLLKNNTRVGSNLASHVTWPSTDGTRTYGSSTNLWGVTWSASDINSTEFGLALRVQRGYNSIGVNTLTVDHVQIKIDYLANTRDFTNTTRP